MASNWTPERRARQAALIRTWKPWQQVTGPRTPDGKATASRNADKGGIWKADRQAICELKKVGNDLLREQRELLRRVMP